MIILLEELPRSKYDVVQDARAMLKIFEAEAASERAKRNDVDNEERHPKPSGCQVKNGELWKDYAILLTKIEVTSGVWGLYNYYKMEVY